MQKAGILLAALLASGNLTAEVIGTATEYVLSRDSGDGHAFRITVDRPDPSGETSLVLRALNAGPGVKPQLSDLGCDGHPLQAAVTAGHWKVPRGCRRISWQVTFENPQSADASSQRSIASSDGTFSLLSEASSLPRLANAIAPEILRLPEGLTGEIFPKPDASNAIRLPAASEAPLFAVLGSKPLIEHSAATQRVLYFADDASEKQNLPAIETIAEGLSWISSLARAPRTITYAYVWLGIDTDSPSFGGAAGAETLLVNYMRGGTQDPVRAALMTSVALHEGAHRIFSNFGTRPLWVEESLAAYMGIAALRRVAPDDAAVLALLEKLKGGAEAFPLGLLEAQRRVAGGDQTPYGAFYVKGVAYWTEMDESLKRSGRPGLPEQLANVLTAKYESNGKPHPELASKLGLRASEWDRLADKYIGS